MFVVDVHVKDIMGARAMPLVRAIDDVASFALFPVAFGDDVGHAPTVDNRHGSLLLGADSAYTTPLEQCVCQRGRLPNNSAVEAVRYGVDGARPVQVQQKQCSQRGCRVTFGPNFCFLGNTKRNTATVSALGDTLFISSKRAFSLRLLRFYTSLSFRGHTSARAFAWSYAEIFCNAVDGATPCRGRG